MASGYAELQFDRPPGAVYQTRELTESPVPKNAPVLPSNWKGVKWSPDGACLLTSRGDQWFRVYDLPTNALEREPIARAGETATLRRAGDNAQSQLVLWGGESIYDYAWYPGMSAADPVSCVFAATSKANPIHLHDACTGKLRCSYLAYDDKDEVTAALSLAFSLDGMRLFAGYNKVMRVFEVNRPGRLYREIPLGSKGTHPLPGRVSCFAANPDRTGMLAVGSYGRCIGVCTEDNMDMIYVLGPHVGGVTQVQFSGDGNYLYSGARTDAYIHCWDLRFPGDVLYSLDRGTPTTQQRVMFDIEPCGRHLASGSETGEVRVFDLQTGACTATFRAAEDIVNGFQFHPYLPLAASASGDRNTAVRWPEASSEDDNDDDDDNGEEETDDDEQERPAKRPAMSQGNSKAQGNNKTSVDGPLHDLLCIWRFPFVYRELPVEGDQHAASLDTGGEHHSALPDQDRSPMPDQDQAPLPDQNRALLPDQDRAALPDQNRASLPDQDQALPDQERAPLND